MPARPPAPRHPARADDGARMILARRGGALLAIAQPAHAQLSARFARAWDFSALPALPEAAREDVALGIALHDLSWAGFEAAPTLNPATSLPHGFREVPARLHAPRWAASVAEAGSFGPWPALLVSLQGIRIYRRFFRRDRAAPEDIAAADTFLAAEDARLPALVAATGAGQAAADQADLLLGACDWLSLLFCGDGLRAPTVPDVPLRADAGLGGVGEVTVRLSDSFAPEAETTGTIEPWPFAAAAVRLSVPARVLPEGAGWTEEAAMRAALAAAPVVRLRWNLARG